MTINLLERLRAAGCRQVQQLFAAPFNHPCPACSGVVCDAARFWTMNPLGQVGRLNFAVIDADTAITLIKCAHGARTEASKRRHS